MDEEALYMYHIILRHIVLWWSQWLRETVPNSIQLLVTLY